jgi:hypothetical protein
LEHHFDGYLMNKIPLIRKLDWRSLVTFKGTWGTISDKNLAANIPLRSPTDIPYMEAGIGMENIFKILQVHATWRLNYLDNPEASNFMVQAGVYFAF